MSNPKNHILKNTKNVTRSFLNIYNWSNKMPLPDWSGSWYCHFRSHIFMSKIQQTYKQTLHTTVEEQMTHYKINPWFVYHANEWIWSFIATFVGANVRRIAFMWNLPFVFNKMSNVWVSMHRKLILLGLTQTRDKKFIQFFT